MSGNSHLDKINEPKLSILAALEEAEAERDQANIDAEQAWTRGRSYGQAVNETELVALRARLRHFYAVSEAYWDNPSSLTVEPLMAALADVGAFLADGPV